MDLVKVEGGIRFTIREACLPTDVRLALDHKGYSINAACDWAVDIKDALPRIAQKWTPNHLSTQAIGCHLGIISMDS